MHSSLVAAALQHVVVDGVGSAGGDDLLTPAGFVVARHEVAPDHAGEAQVRAFGGVCTEVLVDEGDSLDVDLGHGARVGDVVGDVHDAPADPGCHFEVVGFDPEVVAPLAVGVGADQVESVPFQLAEDWVGAAGLGVEGVFPKLPPVGVDVKFQRGGDREDVVVFESQVGAKVVGVGFGLALVGLPGDELLQDAPPWSPRLLHPRELAPRWG